MSPAYARLVAGPGSGRRPAPRRPAPPRPARRGRSAAAPGSGPAGGAAEHRAGGRARPAPGSPGRPARTTSSRPRPRRRADRGEDDEQRRRAAGCGRSPSTTARVRLPATVSVGMSRRLLATRIAQASAPMPTAAYSAGPLPGLGLDVRRADHRDQPEEDEHHHLAEAEVAVRASSRRCRTTRPARETSPTATSHQAVVAASTSPATAATPKRQERRPLHRAAASPPRSRPAAAGRPGRRRCRGCRRSSRWRS